MDPKLAKILATEEANQDKNIYLIPSENFTSSAVRAAVGSVFMHKYSEGYPAARYYEGNERIDELEIYTQELAKSVFKLPEDWSVNVQPLAGSIANLAVYNALLEPGDKIMGMYLYDGGHLSHGWEWQGRKVNITSKFYTSIFYHVDPETHLIDYEQMRTTALENKPQIIVTGGTGYSRTIDHTKVREIADEVGAYYLADIAHEAGLIAAGVYPSPVGIADVVTMTTHKTLRGPKGALILSNNKFTKQIDKSIFPGIQGGPHNGTIAGIAQALSEASQPEFIKYQQQVIKNAQALAQAMQNEGFKIVTGGTDKHLFLVDLTNMDIDGKAAAHKLADNGIIVNANTIPYDPRPPFKPSGIRLGTPFVTTKGMVETDMVEIAKKIKSILLDD